MLPDPDVDLLPLDPEELAAWNEILAQRPQFDAEHDPDCPGITITLHAHRDSCPTCRDWLAEYLRGERQADAEERSRGA